MTSKTFSPYYTDVLAHRAFDVEEWWRKLPESEQSQFTFIPIERPLAAALNHCYRAGFQNRKNVFTADDAQALNRLEALLDAHFDGNCKYFARLSSRSPKDGLSLHHNDRANRFWDVVRNNGVTQEQWDAVYKWSEDGYDPQSTPHWASDHTKMNKILRELLTVLHECMQVCTAQQLLCLLLSSERVFTDLYRALDAYTEAEKVRFPTYWQQHIILKKWDEDIQDSFEFRCFVYNNNMTAISQYNMYIHVPEIDGNEECVTHSVLNKWLNHTKPLFLDVGSYIVDYALHLDKPKEGEHYQCTFIEINPFKSTTGGSLFHWRIDEQILYGRTMTTNVELTVPTSHHQTATKAPDKQEEQWRECRFEHHMNDGPVVIRTRLISHDTTYYCSSITMLYTQWFGDPTNVYDKFLQVRTQDRAEPLLESPPSRSHCSVM